jgi:hypothetical protein
MPLCICTTFSLSIHQLIVSKRGSLGSVFHVLTNLHTVFYRVALIYIRNSSVQGSLFSTSSAALVTVFFWIINNCSNRSEAISISFVILTSFFFQIYPLAFYVFFWEVFIWITHLKIRVFLCYWIVSSSLFIQNINLSPDYSSHIFSPV